MKLPPQTTLARALASPSLLKRIAAMLVRWRIGLLAGALVVSLVAVGPARRLRFDQSIESLFAPDDPLLADYRQSKEWFGGLQQVGVAYADPDLFSAAGMQRLGKLTRALAAVPGVEHSDSLVTVLPALAPGGTSDVGGGSAAGSIPALFRGVMIGQDGTTTAVVLSLEPEETASAGRRETIARIRRVAAAHPLPTVVAGMPVMLRDVFDYVEQDGRWLGVASTVLLVAVIFVLFRSLRWVLLPVALVQASVVWTKALLVLTQAQLSMVSTMLTALVTVIGIATAVHVTVRFRELRQTLEPVEALRQTIVLVGPACCWTCLTTAAGFAALTASQISPVRSFGLMLATGSMLVLFAAACIIPGGAVLGRYGIDPLAAPGERRLGQGLAVLVRWVERRPRTVGLASFAVLAVAGAGYVRLEVETDFTRNFRAAAPIVKAYDFVEDRMGGAGLWEINFPVPEDAGSDFFGKVSRFSDRLRKVDGITKVDSLVDVVAANPATQATRLLTGPAAAVAVLQRLRPDIVKSFWNQESRRMRVLLRAKERQAAGAKRVVFTRAREIAQQEFPVGKAQADQAARVTGTFVLFTFLIESLMRDQVVTFVLAAFLIVIMLSVAFRSWKLALVAMVPNGCPILVVVGVMGWLGMKVNMATAMIASVSMGLAVDFSIHYLTRYRQERAAGLDFYEALGRAHQSAGRALVLASIALVTGFSVLCLSNFVPTVNFGILVSAAMLGGLAGNLVLLPLLLTLLPGQRRR